MKTAVGILGATALALLTWWTTATASSPAWPTPGTNYQNASTYPTPGAR